MKKSCGCNCNKNPAGPGRLRNSTTSRQPLRELQNHLTKGPPAKRGASTGAIRKSQVTLSTSNVETQTSVNEPAKKRFNIKTEAKAAKSQKLNETESVKAHCQKTQQLREKSEVKSVHNSSSNLNGQEANKAVKENQPNDDADQSYVSLIVPRLSSRSDSSSRCFSAQTLSFSPILPNQDRTSNISLSRNEPAQKKTLLHAKRAKIERRDPNSSYLVDIYNSEYFFENLDETKRIDKDYIVKRNFLNWKNIELNASDRIKVVHWIMIISVDIGLSDLVYFKFVRLFDNILERISVAKNMLQLVAIVTCWILMKMHEVSIPTIKKIGMLCSNQYSKQQIIEIEKKLLTCTQFNLHVSSPSDFYVSIRNHDSYELAIHCMNYILEIFTFNEHYSQFSSSEVASAAAFLTVHYFHINLVQSKNEVMYKTLDSVRDIVYLIDYQLMKMFESTPIADHEYTVYKKYNDASHQHVSGKLRTILIAVQQRARKEHTFLYS